MDGENNMGKVTHGMTGTLIYRTWSDIIQRCCNPKAIDYSYYGGRGISVSERWRKFENFYADMGEKPEGLSIDRIDNDGNYCLENCKWSTMSEQSLNKRIYSKNCSGLSGVTRQCGKWYVQIKRNGINHHLGMTDDFFEACCLRKSAEAKFA